MRHFYTLAAAMLIAASSLHAQAPAKTDMTALSRLTWNAQAMKSPKAADDITADQERIVCLDEHFDNFTEGSEDAISTTSLLDDMGNFTNPSKFSAYDGELSYKPWGGGGLYAAGGCVAIVSDASTVGFLNTPAGNMSGLLTIKFRARLAAQQPADASPMLDVILLSRRALKDYLRTACTITDEWKEYTITTDYGWFTETGIQFWPQGNGTFLIDDIHVERINTSIMPPTADEPTDLTDTGFTANWQPTADADEYLVSVYNKKENWDNLDVAEGFDGIVADAEGNVDIANANLPKEWTLSWGNGGKGVIATAQGDYNDGKQAVRLINAGDFICTPTYKNRIQDLKFWVKCSPETDSPALTGHVMISTYTSYGWTPWRGFNTDALLKQFPDGVEMDLSEYLTNYEDCYAFKITYMRDEADRANVIFDNFRYTVPGEPILEYALHDEVVKGRDTESYAVTGLDPDKDYFYTVKARNSKYTSDNSNEAEVYGVSQPKALPATNVTDNGYTANWTCGPKADAFRVEQVQQRTYDKDDDNVVVLYEDFSKVVSYYTEDDIANGDIEYGFYTDSYQPIDDYTHLAGWTAASTMCVDGWLGGMAKGDNTTLQGCIVTPVMDLSHNDGECYVEVKAWGTPGDWLDIRGGSEVCSNAIEFPEEGFVTRRVALPMCSSKEKFYFYSNNGYPFLIDYIRITQPMKAGETSSITTASTLVEDSEARSADMADVAFSDDSSTAYTVTALRYRNGDYYDRVASSPSNLITVKEAATGVDGIVKDADSISAVSGGISVSVAEGNAMVNVFNAAGQIAAARECAAGTTVITLAKGIYVVKAGNVTKKVVVE